MTGETHYLNHRELLFPYELSIIVRVTAHRLNKHLSIRPHRIAQHILMSEQSSRVARLGLVE